MNNRSRCWCGQDALKDFSPSYGLCPSCGTLVLLNGPTQEQLRVKNDDTDFYGRGYFAHLTADYGLPDLTQRARCDLPERCLHWLRAVLKYRHPPGSVLEIGSGHGGFVGLLRWAGFDATGLELSNATAAFAKEEFGAPTLVGPIEEQKIAPASLDVIVSMDVVEHLVDPEATVRLALSLLRPGGLLVLQTPRTPSGKTYEELVATQDPFLSHLKEREHLYLFSESGIVDFLARLGCPYVSFEPAVFAHYDMFLVASAEPLRQQADWQVTSDTPHPPEARLVRALLDCDDALNAYRQRADSEAQQLAGCEADRAARLEVIHRQGAQVAALQLERDKLQGQIDLLLRPWSLARAAVERIRGHREVGGADKADNTPATPSSAEDLAKAISARSDDPALFSLWEAHGVHVTPVHFYSPIPHVAMLPESLWQRPSEMVGVDLDEGRQLTFLREIRAFKPEYDAFPRQSGGPPHQYYFDQWMFRSVDAEVLYCMVRSYRPRRVVEVGSGFSTLVSSAALQRNAAAGHGGEIIAIEPYPSEMLGGGVPHLGELRRQPVQEIDLALFESLVENDILFIDSSHVLRLDSDVRFLFLEVLPRLQPGVLVHVHDVFLPAHYPRQWVVEEHRFWTEQYLLQAFLAFNRAFEVLWAGSFMRSRHPELLQEAFASYDSSVWPGSFWFRRTAEPR